MFPETSEQPPARFVCDESHTSVIFHAAFGSLTYRNTHQVINIVNIRIKTLASKSHNLYSPPIRTMEQVISFMLDDTVAPRISCAPNI